MPRFTDVESTKDLEIWEMTESPKHSPPGSKEAQELLQQTSSGSSAGACSASGDKGERPVSLHSSGSGESADQKETMVVIGPGSGGLPFSTSLTSVQTPPATRTEFPDDEPFANRGA